MYESGIKYSDRMVTSKHALGTRRARLNSRKLKMVCNSSALLGKIEKSASCGPLQEPTRTKLRVAMLPVLAPECVGRGTTSKSGTLVGL